MLGISWEWWILYGEILLVAILGLLYVGIKLKQILRLHLGVAQELTKHTEIIQGLSKLGAKLIQIFTSSIEYGPKIDETDENSEIFTLKKEP